MPVYPSVLGSLELSTAVVSPTLRRGEGSPPSICQRSSPYVNHPLTFKLNLFDPYFKACFHKYEEQMARVGGDTNEKGKKKNQIKKPREEREKTMCDKTLEPKARALQRDDTLAQYL